MADSEKESKSSQSGCSCVTDPFADLPPEARLPSNPPMGKLRQVTCAGCGLK